MTTKTEITPNESPPRPTSVSLIILLLLVIATVVRSSRPPAVKPCGDLRPVTIGGSMVVGCRNPP